MIYNSEHIAIAYLKREDALLLNKLFVSNTERFINYLPQTLEENTTLGGTQNYIEKQLENAATKKEFSFVIHPKNSRDIVGLIILKNLDWNSNKGEFAYCIGERFEGKGLMTEAIKAVTAYVLKNYPLEILQIVAHQSNLPSVNVALGAGFVWKETLEKEYLLNKKEPQDMELFEYTKKMANGNASPSKNEQLLEPEVSIKDRFYNYILALQDTITSTLEAVDGKAKFQEDLWERPEGGGGRTRVITDGAVFEKGGVNISAVHGQLPDSMQQYFGVKDADFFACGLSLVLHPKNPMVPTVHSNWRYFEMYDQAGEVVDSWFGGGQDLTPYYLFEEDAVHFHEVCKSACEKHNPTFYELYKKKCDAYFWNSHRDEARGIGGLFFDYCKTKDGMSMDAWYDFVTEVGNSFLHSYVPIVEKRKPLSYTESQRTWQEIRRGRYVEFNLVHDKGTLFGLKTNGRIESILMSLPPHVQWVYDHQPEKGSAEERLLDVLKHPVDWVAF